MHAVLRLFCDVLSWKSVLVLASTSLVLAFCSLFLVDIMQQESEESKRPPQAYLLHTSVTHGRYIPVASKHAFTYPALYTFVSLRSLESRALDIGMLGSGLSTWSWAFGYANSKRRLTAINPRGYLSSGKKDEKATILERLEELLRNDSAERTDVDVVDDAWMLTMPSFLGWEGINPLTVYFVYSSNSQGDSLFSYVVLEIHNTFGESHVYVLKVGINEDTEEDRGRGYDHQWTFPRQFHVSPFNDRSGFYSVAIKRPTDPPSSTCSPSSVEPPKPSVRVQLYTDRPGTTTRGELKLSAILRPTAAYPLTGPTILLKSLAKMPFDLLLTMARIHYQAWILHYGKPRLDVYLRPEMKWTDLWRKERNAAGPVGGGGGVRWLDEGLFEKYARRRVERFLEWRAVELGVKVTLVSANPAVSTRVFGPRQPGDRAQEGADECSEDWTWRTSTDSPDQLSDSGESKHLRIGYLSAKLFTILMMTPSAEHALLVGCDTEQLFQVSSRSLFSKVFSSSKIGTPEGHEDCTAPWSNLQRLRVSSIPAAIRLETETERTRAIPITIPSRHFLDDPPKTQQKARTWFSFANFGFNAHAVTDLIVLLMQNGLDGLEKRAFGWLSARVVEGQEPWMVWERAARVYWGQADNNRGSEERNVAGSVRRDR